MEKGVFRQAVFIEDDTTNVSLAAASKAVIIGFNVESFYGKIACLQDKLEFLYQAVL